MPAIEIQHVPGAIKKRINAIDGDNLEKIIIENDLAGYQIFVNGVELNDYTDVNFCIGESDLIQFYGQPLGPVGNLIGAILKPITKILSFLVPKPSIPNQAGQAKESPNNKLTGQTNIARLNQARPDIYGAPVSYPDLINESLFEYRDNEKFLTEWMNFGIGVYTISRLRYSESNLSTLAGSAYSIYGPGQVIPLINEGFEFADVDGQVIPGPNENDEFPAYEANSSNVVSYYFFGQWVGIRILRMESADAFDYFYDLQKPHEVTFFVNIKTETPSGDVYTNTRFSATLYSMVAGYNGNPLNPEFYYDIVFSNVNPPLPSGVVIALDYFRLQDNENLVIGPFFAPVPGDQFWIHLQADLTDGNYANTQINYYKVDDDNVEIPGTSGSIDAGFPAAGSSETFFKTVKITPSAGYGRYAFRFKRLENSNDQSVLRLEEIHSVRRRFNVVHPNDTVITIEIRATKQATGGRDRKFNGIANRHTISYNMTTQSVDYTLRPSRSFADAVLHTWLVVGNQPESSIDAYELYRIASSLPDQRLGNFDYTFDDEDIALGARIETICNAATVTAYWEDGILSFVRDEKQAFPVMLFNSSNTLMDGYKISYDMTLPGGFDGVDLQYVNPQTNKYEHILLAIVNGQIVKQTPRKASKIELAGCRDRYQAMDRAILECRRLIYSRITQTITALRDGNSVSIGQLVRYSDTLDSNQQDGEIKSRTGNNFITNERINFIGDMYVVVTDYLGNPTEKVQAYPLAGNDYGFTAVVPNVQLNIWDGEDTQAPSRYIIATQQEIDSTLWLVTQKKPNNDSTGNGESAALTLVEYNDEMYDYQDLLDEFMQ